jgi:hypothetical protein
MLEEEQKALFRATQIIIKGVKKKKKSRKFFF